MPQYLVIISLILACCVRSCSVKSSPHHSSSDLKTLLHFIRTKSATASFCIITIKKHGASTLRGITTNEPLAMGSNPVASWIFFMRRCRIARRADSDIARVGVHSAVQVFLQVILRLQANTLRLFSSLKFASKLRIAYYCAASTA